MAQSKPTSVEKNGFSDFNSLGHDLIVELLDRGFEQVFPDPVTPINVNDFVATLRPRAPDAGNEFSPDPLADLSGAQTWHLHINCSGTLDPNDPGFLRMYVTHPLQAQADGTVAEDSTYVDPTATIIDAYQITSGELTSGWFVLPKDPTTGAILGPEMGPGQYNITKDGELTIPFASRFWNHQDLAVPLSSLGALTYSYRLTVSYQGFALVVWEEGQDPLGDRFSWVVVQRPVSPANAEILKTGKCPVFCMYSVGGGSPEAPLEINSVHRSPNIYTRTHLEYDHNPAIYRFTVRELDVYRPTFPVLASVDSPDHRMVINAKQQVGITEGNRYVVSFPNGFNTDRYLYRDEIDLITYTSADVISQYSNVAVTVYGEPTQREYKAMHANLPDNTGMRILILTKGPGF